jgi:hypothetical protein
MSLKCTAAPKIGAVKVGRGDAEWGGAAAEAGPADSANSNAKTRKTTTCKI